MKKLIKHSKSIILSILLTGFTLVFWSFDDGEDFEFVKNMEIYYNLVKELKNNYVEQTDVGKLVKVSIDKMLDNLDPYTNYYPESDIENYRFLTTGEYGGIGASMTKIDGKLVINDIIYNSPSHKAGLSIGDYVLKIQGEDLDNKSDDDISKLVKGQPKTNLKILIKKYKNNQIEEKEVQREKISISSVPFYDVLKNHVGYIKLLGFTENCSKEFKDAFIELKNKKNITSLIIDLRDNPGGLLMEAVNIMNFFVDKGQEIVSTKGKLKQSNKVFKALFNSIDLKIPIVVLVNRGSASASEIIAGAMQDLDRAVILGQKTYGKGLVQNTIDLCYNTKLKVTTAKYYVPSGRCIQILDYKHRNPDGSVGKIPDSLITEFSTLNGRKVYDGGGIIPDVQTDFIHNNMFINALYSKFYIFNFATKFRFTHDSIQSPTFFDFSDNDFYEFVNFLSDKKFEFVSDSEKALQVLIQSIAKEKNTKSEKQISELKTLLKHDINKDLAENKENIKKLIAEEIVSRYYYHKGKIQYQLKNDNDVNKAIEILNSNQMYLSILKGGYKRQK